MSIRKDRELPLEVRRVIEDNIPGTSDRIVEWVPNGIGQFCLVGRNAIGFVVSDGVAVS
jgi:hypothetical protein